MFLNFNYYHFYRSIFVCLVALLVNVNINCYAYTPPSATVEPLHPKGLRISVPHEQGITLVAYHVKFNEDFYSLEAGVISIDIIKPRNGRWVYEDHTTELKEGDMIYFWVHVVYQGLGYNLLNQEHKVTEFYNYDGTPVHANNAGDCETPSITKVLDRDGKLQNVCTNQLIFEDNFNNLNTTRWTVLEQFSFTPDYEFVIYNNSDDNVSIKNQQLVIIPTFLDEKRGADFVRRGTLNLERCTSTDSNNCRLEAVGSRILPPILSGRLNSKNSFAFLYGRVEVRAKLPRGDWIYPLISLEIANDNKQEGWTQPLIRVASASGNPILRSQQGTDLSGYVLCAGALSPIQTNQGQSPYTARAELLRRNSGILWSEDFHTYEIEWREDRILAKVDKTIYGEQKITENAFNQPFYLTLGLAVGGRGEFPDLCMSGNYMKPWKNVGSKAVLDFYEARDNWARTWNKESSDLKIDYIKVWSV
ncbi:hypothetical protein V1477_011163 [Vespula maculifrons]|uniref:Uncharacterized protein n=1 Tax=Vespula maculifrons TaxID=7453 RepID=A0ABD2C445_VESMC